jgi:hypothetical protein
LTERTTESGDIEARVSPASDMEWAASYPKNSREAIDWIGEEDSYYPPSPEDNAPPPSLNPIRDQQARDAGGDNFFNAARVWTPS